MLKKVAAINDLSGVGRCSLSVSLPILSALKIQCCPFPTAILSSQTNYPYFTFLDFTSHMIEYKETWKKLNKSFDCIYSGFLGSIKQVDIVLDFINENKNAFIVVDPVMGDNGILYPTFTKEITFKIKDLVRISDLTTPNLTEACILTNRVYNSNYPKYELINIAKEISQLGPKKVIITGIIQNNNILNLSYDKELDVAYFTSVKYNNKSYSGTGDIFTSIICGLLMKNYTLDVALEKATNFISKVIEYTSKFDTNKNDGVMFELFLSELTNL